MRYPVPKGEGDLVRIEQFERISEEKLDSDFDQGYRNRYVIIDHGHKKNTFMYFFKNL